MYLFLVDETNKQSKPGQFFIVGGLVIRPDQIDKVDESVRNHAGVAGYKPGEKFKFSSNFRPDSISPEAHKVAKSRVIADLRDIGVRMVAAIVLHDIARGQNYDQQMNYGLNTLTNSYYGLLSNEDATGIVIIDRDNHRYDHLAKIFQGGLEYADGGNRKVNDRIRMFAMTTHNASNLCAANDIALGAFRYCVNAAVGDGNEEAAREMFRDLGSLFWALKNSEGKLKARGFGLVAQPLVENIRYEPYKVQYKRLFKKLSSYHK